MSAVLSAQELKIGGMTKIKKMLAKTKDVFVQERGKDRCVIVDLDYYNQLKMYELDVAYMQAMQDIKDGNYVIIDNPEEHVAKLLEEPR